MSRRVLITGGFGYLGGRVAQQFAAMQGAELVLGSRMETRAPPWLPSGLVVKMSLSDQGSLEAACSGNSTIVHLAAMNEIEAAIDPVGAMEINAVGTARLVEAAKKTNVRRLIYLSTAHIYGAPLRGRIDESKCPRPIHPYASSHKAAEDVVLAAHDSGSFVGIVLRLSNAFGVPAHPKVNRWTLLVNDLCRQAAKTGRLGLRSAGLQKRDFITLTDAARAIVHFHGLDATKVGDGVFNVGGAWAPSVLEIAELVAARCERVLGFRPPIQRPEPKPDEANWPLDYRIDKLLGTGFVLTGNRESEIDATLAMCKVEKDPAEALRS